MTLQAPGASVPHPRWNAALGAPRGACASTSILVLALCVCLRTDETCPSTQACRLQARGGGSRPCATTLLWARGTGDAREHENPVASPLSSERKLICVILYSDTSRRRDLEWPPPGLAADQPTWPGRGCGSQEAGLSRASLSSPGPPATGGEGPALRAAGDALYLQGLSFLTPSGKHQDPHEKTPRAWPRVVQGRVLWPLPSTNRSRRQAGPAAGPSGP